MKLAGDIKQYEENLKNFFQKIKKKANQPIYIRGNLSKID